MRSGKLVAKVVSRRSIDAPSRDAMWAVFSRYYADVTRSAFDRDLDNKQRVIMLRDSGDGSVQGFSTLEVYSRELRGKSCDIVFTGDTVIDEAYWGQQALQRAFAAFLYKRKLSRPFTPVYWFLISKGYRTYLLMARNFTTYWPRHDAPTPAGEVALIEDVARHKFGDAFADGILRFDECAGRVKEGVAPIDSALLAHPDIRFFVEKNPHHARGDELCCLGRVDLGCVWRFTSRAVAKLLRPRIEPRLETASGRIAT